MIHPTIIIGAGPAGIAAAIQLKRAGIGFLIIEKNTIGGLLNNANLVENYPGFSKGITGKDLVKKMKDHIDTQKISLTKDKVTNIEATNDHFLVVTTSTSYKCKNLIIASGTIPKTLDKSTYGEEVKEKILYEIHSIQDIKNNHIAIIGGGDAAFDHAMNLARNNKTSLLYRNKYANCLPLLHDRAIKNESIDIYAETQVIQIEREKDKAVVKTDNLSIPQITVDYVVAAIGREPALDFISPVIKNHFLEKRHVPRLYYAGDVIRGNTRQVAISVGDGMKAAMDIMSEKDEGNS